MTRWNLTPPFLKPTESNKENGKQKLHLPYNLESTAKPQAMNDWELLNLLEFVAILKRFLRGHQHLPIFMSCGLPVISRAWRAQWLCLQLECLKRVEKCENIFTALFILQRSRGRRQKEESGTWDNLSRSWLPE